MSIPAFLRKRVHRHKKRLDLSALPYQPLLGSWLIEMALMLNWHQRNGDERWPSLFKDSEFVATTGLAIPEKSRQSPSDAQCRERLTARLGELEKEALPPDLPLFTNLELLAELLDLNQAEQALLLFASLFDLFDTFRGAVASRSEHASDHLLWRILAGLTGLAEPAFRAATGAEAVLVAAGLIKINHAVVDLESKLDLMEGLSGILLVPHADVEELMGRFLRRAAPPSLALDNFPHLATDTALLRDYLKNALATGAHGVNILLSGKPGVGKTEYVQALAAELGTELYEISYAGPDGAPIKGENRLRAYSFCQRLLARSSNAILMFDEIEDVFPASFGFLGLLFGVEEEAAGRQCPGKAWINRTMEQNRVPALWVSNRTSQIDHAYRRRFDYSIDFPVPPRSVRLTIARHHLGRFEPPRDWLEGIAGNEELTPGQLERAAKVAAIAAKNDLQHARSLVDQALERSSTLLEQKRPPRRKGVRAGYDLAWLNTDLDIPRLILGLKQRPQGSLCFYGAPGTGKSELARHIGEVIDRQVILRRASDLFDKYLGESEKNIAAMFDQARQQNALLVLDEADSFLADRRGAQRSWEVTQVNELLTQMENFEGIFICTTNLMERLDQASLRRFAFKIRFDPLTPEQSWGLFRQEIGRLGLGDCDLQGWESPVRQLTGLTPGDFTVATRQAEICGAPANPGELYELLRRECCAKEGGGARIGFSA